MQYIQENHSRKYLNISTGNVCGFDDKNCSMCKYCIIFCVVIQVCFLGEGHLMLFGRYGEEVVSKFIYL